MTKIVSQLARGLCMAVAVGACSAQAQPAYVPERKLEARWQVELPADPGRRFETHNLRLRVQDDGRVSLGLPQVDGTGPQASDAHLVLVTVGGDGQLAGRVPVKGPGNRNYTVVALRGGDFLVHVEEDDSAPGMQLRHIAADGTERAAWKQAIDPSSASRLLDAVVRDDGLIIAAVSVGIGPNDILAIMVLGAGDRPLSDFRLRVLLIGTDEVVRIHPWLAGHQDQSFQLLGTGMGRSGSSQPGHFAMSFSLDGSIVTASPPVDLGPEYILCHAMTTDGHVVLGLSVPDNDRYTLLRWLNDPFASDWRQALETQRRVARTSRCNIVLREDRSGAVWLEPRQLLAFGADHELLWRAAFDADVVGIAWMADGDVVALHATDTGVRLVRYSPR